MTVLEADDVCYTYSPHTPFCTDALKHVSFSVNAGEVFGIIGHTGSGKSTLLQLMNGLLKPTSGRILLNGKDIWNDYQHIRRVRFEVGLVFQYPEYQLFEETALADIAYGPKNKGRSPAEALADAARAAETVKLDRSLWEKSPFDLSGGEKRRVAIAGIMAMNPDVIVFDEPTAGLDPVGRERVIAAIEDYRVQHHATVIIVSHSMEDMALMCDRIMVLNNGEKILLDDIPGVFTQAETLQNIGLAVPYVTGVLLRLKAKGLPVRTDCFTVADAVAEIRRLAGTEVLS